MKSLTEILTGLRDHFHSLVPFDVSKERLILMDLSISNTELSDEIIKDTLVFEKYVESFLSRQKAKYAIGGYAEDRMIYKRSINFHADSQGGEPRSLHLGLDIWGAAGTEVYCPIQGKVHSFAFNGQFGDYGATIILEHDVTDFRFHTLYGHVSLRDLSIQEGMIIEKGTVFAHFGTPTENGSWPPHLHFQIIQNLEDYKGDYPGVCRSSEKEKYLQNCPDPDIIAQLQQYL